jgi:hypothetical protein
MILLKLIIVIFLSVLIFNFNESIETFYYDYEFCPGKDLIDADPSNSYANPSKGWCQMRHYQNPNVIKGKTIDDVNNCYINNSDSDADSDSDTLLGTNDCPKS